MVKMFMRKMNAASGSIGFTVAQRIPGLILAIMSCRMIMPARTPIETGSLMMKIATR